MSVPGDVLSRQENLIHARENCANSTSVVLLWFYTVTLYHFICSFVPE